MPHFFDAISVLDYERSMGGAKYGLQGDQINVYLSFLAYDRRFLGMVGAACIYAQRQTSLPFRKEERQHYFMTLNPI